ALHAFRSEPQTRAATVPRRPRCRRRGGIAHRRANTGRSDRQGREGGVRPPAGALPDAGPAGGCRGAHVSRSGGSAERPSRHRDVPSEPRSWPPAPGAGAACTRNVNRSAKRNGPVSTAEGAVVNLDCQQVRELMDSYLSEELSVETNHRFLRHVAECRDCAAELKRRRRLRALLSETLDLPVNDVNADRVRMRTTHAVAGDQR